MGVARRAAGRRIRVVVVDDHRSFAQSLRVALGVERGIEVAAVCHDGQEAVEVVRRKRPDVVLMDLEMPGMDGVAATRAIFDARPETRVVMLSAHQGDHLVARAIDAGAVGFLSKSVAVKEVARSVRTVARGQPLFPPEELRRLTAAGRRRRREAAALRERVGRLSARETQILQRMADGASGPDIARELGITPNTLRTHLQNILFKLKVHSKVEALSAAIRYGKVRADSEA